MNTREQFGKFLLLKKLTEDALGETFRAGLLGPSGMERIVLLRVFNGQGLDGPRLWESAKDRRTMQSQLHNANIGEGVELGELRGIPYVAYDYISGKNMATLLEQAAKKRNYIPIEHALLISERVALALAVAFEHRYQDQRILHGFVVPHLMMISNEGETRVLGFEVGPGLRAFAGNPVIRQHYGRYLAPEVHAGAELERSDDIYSLGVMLFELLTGRPLPPPGADGYASVIDQGVLATEGTPIPAELNQLLKKSLVPRADRIPDAVTWQKALNKVMFEGQYNPTTFNLAFFMHNLFRQEIERENQEMEVEKTLPVPVVAQSTPPPPVASPSGAATVPISTTAAPSEETSTGIRDITRTGVVMVPPQKSKTGLFAGLAAVLLLIIGGGFGYMWWNGQQADQQAAAAASIPPPPPAEPAGPSPEEIQAKIKELIDQQTSALEENIRGQYDDQLKDLEKQLTDARAAAERRRSEREAAEQLAREREAAAAEEQKAAAELPAESEPEPAASPTDETDVAEAAPPPPPENVAPPPPPPPKPVPPPPPVRAQVRRGDLVEPGPGVIAPKVERLTPRFPEMARRMGKRDAKVTVKVLVDENGKALKTELVGEKVGFGFDQEALQAARTATYSAATKNGVPVKIWFMLTVEFRP